jgi:hypothetical protein
MKPRTLPRVAKDVVHILDGRRVVSLTLPPRRPRGSAWNYARGKIVGDELARRRGDDAAER